MHVDTRIDGLITNQLTCINENRLVNFMEEFYEKCPVKPEAVDYVEAYGCALKVKYITF